MLSSEKQLPPELVQLDIEGRPSLRELLRLVDQVRRDVHSSGGRVLLVRVHVQSTRDAVANAILGEHIAQQLAAFGKIAWVEPRSCETRGMELVANRLGACLRMFDAEEPARAWLEASRPNPSIATLPAKRPEQCPAADNLRSLAVRASPLLLEPVQQSSAHWPRPLEGPASNTE